MISIWCPALNEAEYLDFWVNHHKRLADEFVLVDTGSDDGTYEKAKALGVKVGKFQWNHHFGEAKNYAMGQCNGDWLLSLAPDTYIEQKDFDKIREAIKTDYYGFKMRVQLHYRDWHNIEEGELLPPIHQHLSLFRKDPRIIYHGRVHETVDTSFAVNNLKVEHLNIIRHHNSIKPGANKIKNHYFEHLRMMDNIQAKLGLQYDKIEDLLMLRADDLKQKTYKEEL